MNRLDLSWAPSSSNLTEGLAFSSGIDDCKLEGRGTISWVCIAGTLVAILDLLLMIGGTVCDDLDMMEGFLDDGLLPVVSLFGTPPPAGEGSRGSWWISPVD